MTAQGRVRSWGDSVFASSLSWRFFLAALAAALVTLLGAGTASAATLTTAETRVGASTPTVVHLIGVHESFSAGQHRVNASPQAKTTVATGVAAKTADNLLPGLPKSAPKPLGLGSTGRVAPGNLTEQLAMTAVRADPAGAPIARVVMSDARSPAADGWVKMQQIENGVNIHYVRNTVTGAIDDFKFK